MAIDLDVHGNTKPLEAAVQAAINRIRRQPIKITVDDKGATQPLGNMKRAADEFSKSMEAANARILAFGASMAIINGVADAFKGMVRNLVEVEKSLADINVVMGLSTQNLDKFGDGLFKVAKETGAAFRVAADAATEYARQGLAVEETLKRTRDALVLTRLTGMDSAEAVKSLTAAMNTYGNQIKDTTQLVSKFAAVDVQFAVSAEDFAAAISRTGQAAKSAGVNIDELIGIVTSAQQQTARGGAVIGNALKTIFTKTGRTDTLNQLENLGIAVRDLEGNTIGAKRILSDLANTFDTLSEAQKAQITQTMGGLFHINILKAVLSDAAKQNGILANATQISANATDEAIQKNEQLRQTMSAMATETGLAVKQLSVQIGELMLAPGMEKILNAVKSIAEGAGDLLGDGESAGSKFANGFLKGLGNIITGPGLVVLSAVFIKLFGTAVKFTKESLTSLIGVTSEAQKQKAIQTTLVTLLGQNAALGKEMLRTDISRTEKEKILLGLLRMQTAEAENLNRVSKQLASTLYTKGYGPGLTQGKRRAYGHIPNFADPERAQAAKGGYAAGSIRTMNMPGEGSVIYNSAETVKNFAGFKQPAIMPPQSSKAGKNYQQAFGSIHGFDPYAAGGYIPNFALTPSQILDNALKAKRTTNLTKIASGENISGQSFSESQRNAAALALQERSAQSKTTLSKTSDIVQQKSFKYLNPNSINYIGLSASLGPDIPKNTYYVAGGSQTSSGIYSSATAKGFNDALKKGVPGAKVDVEFRALDNSDKQKAFGRMDDEINTDLQKNSKTIADKILSRFKKSPMKQGDVGTDLPKNKMSVVSGHIFEAVTKSILRQIGAKGAIADRPNELIDLGYNEELYELFGIQKSERKGQNGAEAKLNTTEKNVKSLARKIYNLHTGFHLKGKGAANGYIPNFADPLSDAIGREKAAGVPVSQIRVGSHSALMSKGNPLGLGVTNTHDEPNGLRDVFGANGFVPNYAVQPSDFLGVNASKRSKDFNKLLDRTIQKYKDGLIKQEELNRRTKRLSSMFGLQSYATEKVNAATNEQLTTMTKVKAARNRLVTSIQNQNKAFAKTSAGRALASSGGQMALMMGLPMAGGFLQDAIGGRTGAAIGGAMSGAATGASIGMMFGPLGTAIGTTVGALGGLVTALNDAKEAQEKNIVSSSKAIASSLPQQFFKNIRSMSEAEIKIMKTQLPERDDSHYGAALDIHKFKKFESEYSRPQSKIIEKYLKQSQGKQLFDVIESFDKETGELKYGKTKQSMTGTEYFDILKKAGVLDSLQAIEQIRIQILNNLEIEKASTEEQVEALIVQLNIQKAQIKSQKAAADAQFAISEKYLRQYNSIDAQEKIMADLMTDQQKAQLKFNRSILKAAEVYDKNSAQVEAQFKANLMAMINSSDTLQASIKTLLAQQNPSLRGANTIDITQALADMSAQEIQNLLNKIKLETEVKQQLEVQLMIRGNALDTQDKMRQSAERQAQAERQINEIINKRKETLDDMLRSNRLMYQKSDFETSKRNIQQKMIQASRQTGGYISEQQQLNYAAQDLQQYTIPNIKSEGKKAQMNIIENLGRELGIGADQDLIEAAIKDPRELAAIFQHKALDLSEPANKKRRSLLAEQSRMHSLAAEETLAKLNPAAYESFVFEGGQESKMSQLDRLKSSEASRMQELNIINQQIKASDQIINLDKKKKELIEDAVEALNDQKKLNNLNLQAAEKELIAREKLLKYKRGEALIGDTRSGFGRGFDDSMKEMRDQVKMMDYELGQKIPGAFANGLATAMTEGLSGAKSIGDALRDAGISFLQMIQQAMMQKAASNIVSMLPFSRGGNVRRYSRGGGVPAMVSNGEYIMGRDAVNKYGGAFMHGLNAGGSVPGFSNGGKLDGFQYKSGRAYQNKKMSGYFYRQSGNVGLAEDASALEGALQEKRRKEEEEVQRVREKVAKRNQRVGQIVSLIGSVAMAGITSGMMEKFGPKAPKLLAEAGISSGQVESLMKSQNLSRMDASQLLINAKKGLPSAVARMNNISAGRGAGYTNWVNPTRPSENYYGGPIRQYASGGYISGAPGIDQIPAMLSEGEYVIRASSARQIGRPMLDRINAGKFNDGGPIEKLADNSETSGSGGNTNNINISVNIEGGSVKGESKSSDRGSVDVAAGSQSQEGSLALADKIKQQVLSVIVEEQRPGGLLSD